MGISSRDRLILNVRDGVCAAHIHEGGLDIVDGHDTVPLAVHGLREQTVRLLDLALLLGGDIVFLCELRPWRGPRCAAGTGGGSFALRRLL